MDADVTESAGTPPERENPAEDEPPTGTPDPDGPAYDETDDEAHAEADDDAGDDAGDDAPADDLADADAVADADADADDDLADAHPADDDGDVPDDDDPDDDPADEVPSASANRRRRLLRWAALATALVVLGGAGAAWWLYRKLNGNITTDTTAAAELEAYEKERPPLTVRGAQNILLIGSDTRAGQGNGKYGTDAGTQRSDTTILLHLAANRSSATAVSVPRDLMVEIPSCRQQDGTRSKEQFAQFNWAFEYGGAACTIRTVEMLTGIRIDHHMVIDFRGFKKMVDAVDGVEVCLKEPINDKDAHLKLAAGRHTLRGEQALGFVRARKSIGDGSDTERMDRQQQFLGSLVRKVQSNGVLLNPTKLYPVLDAATSSITTDPGLNSLRDLYGLVRGMRDIPTEKVQFLTVPRQTYRYDVNRDELNEPEATRLFEYLRMDRPLNVASSSSEEEGEEDGEFAKKPSGEATPSPSPAPTFTGTTAAAGTCR
ncbi:LCP family protein [Streptomyces sp. A3M-1-3]|uniref:LCP family protein n=1 Tax=Streptomyces sp. A3M-1-3 TaxID=2962044 RepID=UPI0020B6E753|nr:LCP family protein [Streptomyces sp. A3M-1-3]MCP3820481.1 LCP family protein [Streptomyces sp. A3M-1-3]